MKVKNQSAMICLYTTYSVRKVRTKEMPPILGLVGFPSPLPLPVRQAALPVEASVHLTRGGVLLRVEDSGECSSPGPFGGVGVGWGSHDEERAVREQNDGRETPRIL